MHNLILLIQKEKDQHVQRILGSASSKLLSKSPENWPEIIQLTLNFLTNSNYLLIGLEIWSEICQVLSEEINNNNFHTISQIFIETFQLNDQEILYSSFKMFSFYITSINSDLINESFTNLPDILLHSLENIINGNLNLKVSNLIFDLIYLLISKEIPIFLDNALSFIDYSLQITNSKLDIQYKISCQNVLSLAPFIMGDEFEEQISTYVQSSINFALEIIKLGTNEFSIDFISLLIDSIIRNTNITEELISYLIELASNAIENENLELLYIIIFALEGAIEVGSEELLLYSDNIHQIIKICCETNNSLLFDATCGFLIDISTNIPSLISPIFDDIINLIFNQINEPRSLQTLDKIIFNSDKTPTNYEQILNSLILLISNSTQEHYSTLISCISSTISKIEIINSNLYLELKSVLVEFLNTNDVFVLGLVFECFGYLSKLSPLSFQEDLNELMNVLINSFSLNNDSLNEYIAVCITSITKILPISIKPYSNQLITNFLQILNNNPPEINNDNENEEEDTFENIFEKSQSAILQAISVLINEMPEDLEEFISGFLEILYKFIDKSPSLQFSSIKSIFLILDGLSSIKYNINPIFDIIIEQIPKTTDISVINELFLVLGNLFICIDKNILENQINQSLQIFIDSFNKKIPILFNDTQFLDSSILNSLYFSFRQFIYSLGENSINYSDQIIEILSPHLGSSKKIIKAFSSHTLSTLCYINSNIENLGELSQGSTLSLITIKEETIKNITLSSINLLIHCRKDLFSKSQITQIRQQTELIIKSKNNYSDMLVSTALTLWCSLLSIFEFKFDNKFLTIVLELLPPVIDDDDIPFTAKFLVYSIQKLSNDIEIYIRKIIINIFSSGFSCIRLIDKNILLILSNYIKEIPNDLLLEIIKYNQHHLLQIQSNLLKFF